MEDRKLSREEIALQLLCAAISGTGEVNGILYPLGQVSDPSNLKEAFKAADHFILERDGQG